MLLLGSHILVIVVHPTVYDGWRHFYFLFAPIVIFAVMGAGELWALLSNLLKKRFVLQCAAAIAIFLLCLSPVFFWMLKNHPFEYVYFNAIARPSAYGNFEKDYWGVSEIKGLEYIMRSDARSTIKLFNEGPIVQISEMLPEEDRQRIEWVEKRQEADYSLSTFRALLTDKPSGEEVFSLKVDGARILSVVKND